MMVSIAKAAIRSGCSQLLPTGSPEVLDARKPPEALPYAIRRRLSRPRGILCLAAGRFHRQPLGAGDAAVTTSEGGRRGRWAAEGAGRKSGFVFPTLSYPSSLPLRPSICQRGRAILRTHSGCDCLV